MIRFNGAPTQGFRKDVGFKTTHHIMYPESAKALPVGVLHILQATTIAADNVSTFYHIELLFK